MRMPKAGRALVVGVLAWPALAAGQATVDARPVGGEPDIPAWVAAQMPNPDDPRIKEYIKRQKRRVEIERELYKLRADFFRNIRNTEIRQAGIAKLRKYNDPAIFPSLLKIFENEGADVQGAVLDILADAKSDEADTTLTWIGIFGKTPEYRTAAAERVVRRIKENGGPTERIKSVVAQGLRPGNLNEELASAAKLADVLDLVEAIPMLINAQIGGATQQVAGSNAGDGQETSLAWIMVGTQTAFVSDLEPVVGDSAVGFDPELSVITEGTYLRVIDAVVVTYRTEVHYALTRLSSRAWGQPTDRLGWDNQKWHEWYERDFVPYLAAKKASAKK